MQRITSVFVFGVLIFFCTGIGGAAPPQPVDYELKLVYIVDGPQVEFVFVIGNSGFKTVAELKRFVAELPAGSTLRWSPGCERLGGEPLLSSATDMAAFVSFCRDHRVHFKLIPSG
jgi:hypothetical protein